MKRFKMFKGDLRPSILATLTYSDGTIVDLTNCTAKIQLAETETGVTVLSKTATVVSPATAGKVQYEWAAGDTNLPKSEYKLRFEVTFADTKIQTFPKDDDLYIVFHDKEGT